jgi:hypothetical protein
MRSNGIVARSLTKRQSGMRRVVLVWLGSVSLGMGCSLFTDLDGLRGTTDAAALDGSPSDAQAPDAGPDGPSADAPSGNLLVNPDFESDAGGCGPGWVTYNATLTRSTIAHSGQYACMVCSTSAGGYSMFATPRPVTDPKPGASYYAQAWFSTVPDAALGSVALELYEYGYDGGDHYLGYMAMPGNTQGYHVVQPPCLVDEAGASIGFEIHASLPDGATSSCFLIDDTQMVPQ